MKKKRKSMFLYYPLIYSKLVLYFFSFYAFLFFGLLTDAEAVSILAAECALPVSSSVD